MISLKLYHTLSRSTQCVNHISTDLFSKSHTINVFRNPCFKPFRTKKSMDVQSPESDANMGLYRDLFSEPLKPGRLKGPLLFTVCTGACCFVGCSIWSYENYINRGATFIDNLKKDFNSAHPRPNEPAWRKDLRHFWNSLHPGERLFAPILFLNGLVFAAWSLPRLHLTMYRFFASNPQSKTLCSPMLLSTFSHQSIFHLLANMFVLHSFMPNAVQDMGKEQFVGFYLTAGVFASLLSYTHKILVCGSGLSLGASGAIMGVLAYTCVKHPDTELGILFVPYFRFSAESAIGGLVLLDTLGVLFKWKLFDHAAHLGGALFGIAYAKWGDDLWRSRTRVVEQWKAMKKTVKGD
uniref:rhomboid protease n=1 Tax=Cacopsylla melanoneura TaxID=428564 RepID=A0A8D8ZUP4_9HEMI